MSTEEEVKDMNAPFQFKKAPCLRPDCGHESCGGWFCREHYLEKEMAYGIYDIKTLNRGFIWWGIKRVMAYYRFRISEWITR